MTRHHSFLFITGFLALLLYHAASFAQASSDYVSPDQYYRAIGLRDLNYRLPSKGLNKKNYFGSSDINSFRGACPDEINIGGIGENTRVIGNVDININIDQDFIIDCNRF